MKYKPHDYQKYAIGFIKKNPIAAILLDMGSGKTRIVLSALNEQMYDSFEVSKVLIIAPLRVARNTWSDEIKKWGHLNGIRYSIAVGTAAERIKSLQADADITAFVLVFPPVDEDDRFCVLPYFWIPEETLDLRVRRDHVPCDVWERQGFLKTTEGNVVHYGFIEKFIERLVERYNIRKIAFDRWGAVQMVQNLEGMGFTVVPFGQGFKDMSPPTKELMKLVLEQMIAHGGHPVLRWMMDNIFIRMDPAGNIKADKEKSTEKIDGAVATIMGLDRAIRCGNETSESVYDSRGLLVF